MSSPPNRIAITTSPGEKKTNKSAIPKVLSSKKKGVDNNSEGIENDPKRLDKNMSRGKAVMESSGFMKRGFSERVCSHGMETLNLSSCDESVVKDIRVFVGTWNLGGNHPNHGLRLDDFLQVEASPDIYVLGFQEVVPLSAGNVLVTEDTEPASKWLALINHALNKKPYNNNIFNKASLKPFSKLVSSSNELLEACNCNKDISTADAGVKSLKLRDVTFWKPMENETGSLSMQERGDDYQIVASKQMVGLFLTIWGRQEVVKAIGHLRVSSVGTGIMGCLGNKGCVSISMTVHQTSLCFVCSHLASGQKEGDELRRNSDVSEIIKGTYFPNICNNPDHRKIPVMILDHERMIWLGDLNYRLVVSYEEARRLLDKNDWDSLLLKDQLIKEKEAGRVFKGWKEGKIMFPPTYKYSHNSDSYAGSDPLKSKTKRRTPAWCDRIQWRGDGIELLAYVRGESRFSDHRPVRAVFLVQVEVKKNNRTAPYLQKGYSHVHSPLP